MFRPIILFRVDRFNFDQKKDFINVLYFTLYVTQRYRMIPYYVEKWNLLFDLNGMTFSQIPYTKLYDVMVKIGQVYSGNV